MLRLIFYAIIIYLVYNLFKNMFSGKTKTGGNTKKNDAGVHGDSGVHPPLDLSKMDVEDAQYVDIDAEEEPED
ncbi:hypothetical protein KAH55_03250 [bacterium]|nr:hypothetical protein [bacterium]